MKRLLLGSVAAAALVFAGGTAMANPFENSTVVVIPIQAQTGFAVTASAGGDVGGNGDGGNASGHQTANAMNQNQLTQIVGQVANENVTNVAVAASVPISIAAAAGGDGGNANANANDAGDDGTGGTGGTGGAGGAGTADASGNTANSNANASTSASGGAMNWGSNNFESATLSVAGISSGVNSVNGGQIGIAAAVNVR